MALTPEQEAKLIAMIPAFENGETIPEMTEATTCDETELFEVSQGGVTKKMSIGTAVSKLSTKGYLYLGIATTSTVPPTYAANDRVYYSIDCPVSATTLTLTNFGGLVIPILSVPTRYSLRWGGASWSGVVDKVSNISQTVGTSTVNVPSENAVLGNVTELESVICGIKTQGYELINGVEFLNSGYIAASDGSENISTDYYFSDYKLVVPFSVISMNRFIGSSTIAKVTFYDNQKSRITDGLVSNDSSDKIVLTVPGSARFAIFCYEKKTGGVLNDYCSVKYEQNALTWEPRKTKVIAGLPDFTLISNATKAANGVVITTQGAGFSPNLIYDIDTYLERCKLSISITITEFHEGGFILNIGKYIGSTYVYMQITNTFIRVCRCYDGGALTKVYEEFLTPIVIEVGLKLVLSWEKTTNNVIFSLTDGVNIVSTTIEKSVEPLTAMMWGIPYIQCSYGTVTINNASFSSTYEPISKLGIWGDSFIEGETMISAGLDKRYVALLSEQIGSSFCPIIGKGGKSISSTWLEEFKIENEWFRPKYVLLALGTNNGNFSVYKEQVEMFIEHVKNRGQIPVLVTITPVEGAESFRAEANAWVRGVGERYVDMSSEVTTDENEEVWNPLYVLPDGLHPSVAGHAAMYKRIKLDVPEILEL